MKSLEIDPKDSKINCSYGYLLYLMGKYEQAMKYIEIDIKLYYKSPWKYFYQGLVYKAIGDEAMADNALLRAVESIETRTEKDRAKKRLYKNKFVETSNMDYYDRFERLIENKFKDYDSD